MTSSPCGGFGPHAPHVDHSATTVATTTPTAVGDTPSHHLSFFCGSERVWSSESCPTAVATSGMLARRGGRPRSPTTPLPSEGGGDPRRPPKARGPRGACDGRRYTRGPH